jgi:pimeloyl-ACP methyl ester carboxylesterase
MNSTILQVKIDGLEINYKTIGNGDTPIVLLHGWVKDCEKYSPLDKYFSEARNFCVFIPDLPGLGKSEEPKEDLPAGRRGWNLDNYVELVDKFIESARRQHDNVLSQKAVIIGHSFGGMIAIKYAVKNPEKISKLILTGAAGIRHRPTIKQKIFFILAKMGKFLFSLPRICRLQKPAQKILYKMARVKDYYQASPRMKEVMKNVLAQDLTPCLEKIKPATLLVWGRLDKTTPLSDGEIMNRKIKNSKMVIIDNANHSLPYQRPKEFIKIIFEFLNH